VLRYRSSFARCRPLYRIPLGSTSSKRKRNYICAIARVRARPGLCMRAAERWNGRRKGPTGPRGQPYWSGEVEECINGRTVADGAVDVTPIVLRLLEERQEDGG